MGSTWVNALLAVISLGTAAILLPAAGRRPAERPGLLAHALMGLGMSGMFAPWGDPVPPAAGALVFGLIAAWFAVRLLRTGRVGLTESTHLVIAPAAMVLMYTAMGPAHAGHTMAMGGAGGSPLLSALALGLLGYFVWYAWILAGRLRHPAPAPCGGDGPVAGSVAGSVAVSAPATVTLTRVVLGAHVAMCALMAVMFLGAI